MKHPARTLAVVAVAMVVTAGCGDTQPDPAPSGRGGTSLASGAGTAPATTPSSATTSPSGDATDPRRLDRLCRRAMDGFIEEMGDHVEAVFTDPTYDLHDADLLLQTTFADPPSTLAGEVDLIVGWADWLGDLAAAAAAHDVDGEPVPTQLRDRMAAVSDALDTVYDRCETAGFDVDAAL